MYLSTLNQDLLGLAVTFNVYRVWDLIVSVPDHCLSFYFWFNAAVIEVCEFLSTLLHVIQLWINSV